MIFEVWFWNEISFLFYALLHFVFTEYKLRLIISYIFYTILGVRKPSHSHQSYFHN